MRMHATAISGETGNPNANNARLIRIRKSKDAADLAGGGIEAAIHSQRQASPSRPPWRAEFQTTR